MKVGDRFGRLVVTELIPGKRNRKAGIRVEARAAVRCDCGVEKTVWRIAMKSGRTRSCGCLMREVSKTQTPPVLRGPDNPHWLETPTYVAMHQRLYRQRGDASDHKCAHCGEDARHWSYRHGCPDELISKKHNRQGRKGQHPYCPHLDCYIALCGSCHRQYDLEQAEAGAHR